MGGIDNQSWQQLLFTLTRPKPIKDWSQTSLMETLIKIAVNIVHHDRPVAFQMAEVAVPRILFADILQLIADAPAASTA
jgi:hypothetical protein